MKLKSVFLIVFGALLFSNCQEKTKIDTVKENYLDFTKRDDQFTGGIKMIPITTPVGKFNVWTKRVGNNPKIKVLLLHGGPGGTHEFFESFDGFFPQESIEYIYYDQLGSYYSDQPNDNKLWTTERFVEEVEQVRRSRWSAIRWALFWPMLGSRVNSSIRSSRYLELYMRGGALGLERHLEAAGELAERIVHVRLGSALRLAHRGDDEVLEQFDVAILDRVLADLQFLEHLLAVDDRLHHAAARTRIEAFVLQLLLQLPLRTDSMASLSSAMAESFNM